MSNLIYSIYKITNIKNNSIYIGKSNNPTDRWYKHNKNAFDYNHDTHLYRAMRKYGKENFIHEILFSTDNPNIINDAEIAMIAMYDTYHNPHHYNSTLGGDGCTVHSKETLLKISINRSGIPHTNESKQKISKALSGEKNYQFEGYYHTPYGIFKTKTEASTDSISRDSISRWCKTPNKIITTHSYCKSPYLQSLKESPLGKTFREIGFWFIQK